MKSEILSKPKRRVFPGPGILIALIAAIVLVISGRFHEHAAPDANFGTIYEADREGKMRRVDTPSVAPGTLPKIWKPEVGLLLQYASELRLGSRQKSRIHTLNADWLREKATLEAALHSTVSEADGKMQDARVFHSASASQIMGSLGDYSRLSHQYNALRASYWTQALATLRPEQTTILEGITTTDRKGNSL